MFKPEEVGIEYDKEEIKEESARVKIPPYPLGPTDKPFKKNAKRLTEWLKESLCKKAERLIVL